MDYQILNTVLGLQSLLAFSLLLEFFYNRRRGRGLTFRFVANLTVFLIFFGILFFQRLFFVY